MLLEGIRSPSDLKKLTELQMDELAAEIRQTLITTVSQNGGHLASNLGIVELTLAIHRVFDIPKDKLLFDVGHQSYVHKLVTGRYARFSTLRMKDGISGFPNPEESPYDCFVAGHASTAISAALGMARARDFQKQHYHVIAVLGDGALTGGMCYEAINDAGSRKTPLIVILNDNEMSIARNVGAVSNYLNRLRISRGWQDAKERVHLLRKLPVVGKPVYRLIHGSKSMLKSVLFKGEDVGFFESLGFEYFGPLNGHDEKTLENTLREASRLNGPCIIHVITQKGHGYEQAEKKPEVFHGTPPFYVETGDRLALPGTPSCGHVMANTLSDMADKDERVVAITAAMQLGTGLDHFAERHKDRLMDVGIAEEHATTLAAGMAACGMRPYFAVYASFFQRCYDQVIHDVCIPHLPVTFLLDRSGIGGEDGRTHHGLFDLSALQPLPGMTVLAPCDAGELSQMLQWTLTQSDPCAIRYAKDGKNLPEADGMSFQAGKWQRLAEGPDGALLAVGTMVRRALAVRACLKERGLQLSVYNCSTVKPLDMDCVKQLQGKPFYTLEEHMLTGGFGMTLSANCTARFLQAPAICFAVPDRFMGQGSHEQLMEEARLDTAAIVQKILNFRGKKL